jgi:AcrR family transcriptional regulator
MSGKNKENPRSTRAKKAFCDALIQLLNEQALSEISVTAITEVAGYSRYTFYNHFQSKDDLLHSIIDVHLDRFFDKSVGWNLYATNGDEQVSRFAKFFEIWKLEAEFIKVIDAKTFDQMLTDRLHEFFTIYYHEEVVPKASPRLDSLSQYVIAINTYLFAGTFRTWINDGMKVPPEKMGLLLEHYLGPKIKLEMLEKLKEPF